LIFFRTVPKSASFTSLASSRALLEKPFSSTLEVLMSLQRKKGVKIVLERRRRMGTTFLEEVAYHNSAKPDTHNHYVFTGESSVETGYEDGPRPGRCTLR
jgi:hypothetical protein